MDGGLFPDLEFEWFARRNFTGCRPDCQANFNAATPEIQYSKIPVRI
jgi:hypothetical protein